MDTYRLWAYRFLYYICIYTEIWGTKLQYITNTVVTYDMFAFEWIGLIKLILLCKLWSCLPGLWNLLTQGVHQLSDAREIFGHQLLIFCVECTSCYPVELPEDVVLPALQIHQPGVCFQEPPGLHQTLSLQNHATHCKGQGRGRGRENLNSSNCQQFMQ